MEKRYFPGLHGLRAYAALSVVIGHTLDWLGIHTGPVALLRYLVLNGDDAVTLFFVLSGFLIGYNILQERGALGTVDVRRFWWRRIIRIWPLYFFVIILSALLTPHLLPDIPTLTFVVFISPHLVRPLGGALYVLGAYWSLGIEEWFYGLFPLFARSRGFWVITSIIVVARAVFALAVAPGLLFVASREGGAELVHVMRFDAIAIGVIGAGLVAYQHRALHFIHRLHAIGLVLFVGILLLNGRFSGIIYDLTISIVFLIVILTVATHPRPLLTLEGPVLRWIGERSYSIYMLHYLAMATGYAVYVFAGGPGWWLRDTAAVLFVVAITLGASNLSYRFVERPFQRLRHFHRRPARLPRNGTRQVNVGEVRISRAG